MLRNRMSRAASAGFDYESPYGSPTATVTTFPSNRAGLNNNNQDFCMALDAEFTTLSDVGLIMESGGSRGMSWGAYGNGSSVLMRARAYSGAQLWSDNRPSAAKVEVNITPYVGRFNTFYLTGDVSVGNIKIWVQAGGRGSTSNLVLLGTGFSDASSLNAYGSAGGGYGTSQGNMPDLNNNGTGGASNVTYEAIYPSPSNAAWYKELRERTRGNYNFSAFGSSFDRV